MAGFEDFLSRAGELVRHELDIILVAPDGPESRLFEAMRYSVLGEGKAFRPGLCLATANLFDVKEAQSVRAATAIECVHCYSLVHDDLPSMDDDDRRRGKPSAHKAFDEATAILAGDALLTLGFDILADEVTHKNAETRLALIIGLAQAAGMHGMVGGQMMDVLSLDLSLDAGGLTRLQKMKTGALINFSVDAGALLGDGDKAQRQALSAYAHDVGLAYQIADDVLDIEGRAASLGKTPGKDAEQKKTTFASLLGVERAQAQAQLLVTQAIEHLDIFGAPADSLRDAAAFAIARHS